MYIPFHLLSLASAFVHNIGQIDEVRPHISYHKHTRFRPPSQNVNFEAASLLFSIPAQKETETVLRVSAEKPQTIRGLSRELEVLFEDDTLLAVNKPAGLLCHQTDECPGERVTLAGVVWKMYRRREKAERRQQKRLETEEVDGHGKLGSNATDLLESPFKQSPSFLALGGRLDRASSGVVLFTKSREAATSVSRNWHKMSHTRKIYMAICPGKFPDQQVVDKDLYDLLKGRKKIKDENRKKPAFTVATRVGTLFGCLASLVLVEIFSGRRFQIRRHLHSIGHPIIGDRRHGGSIVNRVLEEVYGVRRLLLHKWRFAVRHPKTEEEISVQAPLSPQLRSLLAQRADPPCLPDLLRAGIITLSDFPLVPEEIESADDPREHKVVSPDCHESVTTDHIPNESIAASSKASILAPDPPENAVPEGAGGETGVNSDSRGEKKEIGSKEGAGYEFAQKSESQQDKPPRVYDRKKVKKWSNGISRRRAAELLREAEDRNEPLPLPLRFPRLASHSVLSKESEKGQKNAPETTEEPTWLAEARLFQDKINEGLQKERGWGGLEPQKTKKNGRRDKEIQEDDGAKLPLSSVLLEDDFG
uniref:Pseudouridine synthase RsuA/RluA-like domain-containing protein n=1 Tax=Chromera velia CCMP2878 TaxID=1169474 RepID=A0A0G4F7B0_9ALVE|eukprot:Cvel_2887.t1-p1 / transcript=Cvel_2887.t1 / gene=Cvel_2887 / organism=Chromera_velia_CCMP2878 / gene_product=tRNA pseudouridine synthase C, putative / transcript_product=tRNA pseudouridine synthase C, putative / location=Cvel_scaffold114:18331-21644(-) / protein_length=589 / sequence_SO=supercontig / SO=protein_coding / is_pseudo=false